MHGVGALLPSASQGQLSIANATKKIVARAIVTKKETHPSCNAISNGFHYNEYFSIMSIFRSQSVCYTDVLLYI